MRANPAVYIQTQNPVKDREADVAACRIRSCNVSKADLREPRFMLEQHDGVTYALTLTCREAKQY
jgi:hypothetical protein